MAPNKRLLVPLGAILLLVSAGLGLRAVQQTQNSPPTPPTSSNFVVRPVDRFTNRNVDVPQAFVRPAVPSGLRVISQPAGLLIDWIDAGASGYQVSWYRAGEPGHTMLTIPPEVVLGGLENGKPYTVDVRAVDADGDRSAPASATGTPGRATDTSWKKPLTGLWDDFSQVGRMTQRWHVSGYQGCVDAGSGGGHLVIGLECGADQAVLRARSAMTLLPGKELGRIAVVTDAAGPGGQLTVDLAPGPVDRVGSTLPPGTIRVVVDDQGARVLAADDVPKVTTSDHPSPAPARGVGVQHLFEVVLTTSGIQVLQDGILIGVGGAVPSWQQASVLFGFRGPTGFKSRVHVSGAGFSGPAATLGPVSDVPVVPATLRVLGPTEQAPGIGVSRQPLIGAVSARVVATVLAGDGFDPGGLSVQLGGATYAMVQAIAGPAPPGDEVTEFADLPASLLTPGGPDPLSPFVLRAARGQAMVVESYLEVHPPSPPLPQPVTALGPVSSSNSLPSVTTALSDANGKALSPDAVPRSGRISLDITLTGRIAQWDGGGVAGVQGFQVWLDGTLMAGVPTDAGGPGVGGRYSVVFGDGVLRSGQHVVEVREYGSDGGRAPVSVLTDVTVT